MSQLSERQAEILNIVVRDYVETAEPVGSQAVSGKLSREVSSATIRNDMANLEQLGYLASPHTSAGRVPTNDGYRYYIKNSLQTPSVPRAEERELSEVWASEREATVRLKRTAKVVAHFADEGVFLAFGRHDVFYTGLSNLLSQPEFTQQQQLVAMTRIIDHLDEVIGKIFAELSDEVEVLVGKDNPFGSDCGVVMARYQLPEDEPGIFGILGPARMDYDTNVARVQFVQEQCNR